MSTHQLAIEASSGIGVRPRSPQRAGEPGARVGLLVELHTTPGGVLELAALPDHRVKVHAGGPVRGACRRERFLYTRGDIDILPAGMSDVWHEEDSNTSLILQLSPSLLRRVAEDLGADPDGAGLEPRHQIRDAQIEHIAWALEAERAAGYPNGVLYTETLGSALVIHLLRRYPTPLRSPRGLPKPRLRRVTEYIEEYLDQDLSLSRLAEVAGVSASHFKTLFKCSTGLPVHEYVIQRRVERARMLLLRGHAPASRVALDSGFSHQSHMARWMRRMLGVTPAALMRRADHRQVYG